MKTSKYALVVFVALKLMLQFLIINSQYELHRDEFLYLDQAHHLAWGYQSVPPFTSWIALVMTWLGGSFFWIKFFPAMNGAFVIVIVWLMIDDLNGMLYAKVLAAFALLFSGLLRIDMLFQQNSFDVLAWTLIFYLTVKYVKTEQNKLLMIIGVVAGFAFLNKYTIIFLLAGLVTALMITPHRSILAKKQFYYTILIATIIALPNIIWQINNDLPVARHMSELTSTQLANVERIGFLTGQLLFFSLAIFIAAIISFFRYESFKPYRFIFWCFLFAEMIFSFFRAKSYYAIGLFPVLIAFGSVYWENILDQGWKRYLRPVLLLVVVIPVLLVARAALPILSPAQIQANSEKFKKLGLLRWEDGKDHELPQDFADMIGWKELEERTAAAFKLVPESETSSTLILCGNYGQAGAINYYSKGSLPAAVSFNADYLKWFPLSMKIKNIILIKSIDEKPISDEERQLFSSIQTIGSVSNQFAREYGTTIYLLRGADPSVRELLVSKLGSSR